MGLDDTSIVGLLPGYCLSIAWEWPGGCTGVALKQAFQSIPLQPLARLKLFSYQFTTIPVPFRHHLIASCSHYRVTSYVSYYAGFLLVLLLTLFGCCSDFVRTRPGNVRVYAGEIRTRSEKSAQRTRHSPGTNPNKSVFAKAL